MENLENTWYHEEVFKQNGDPRKWVIQVMKYINKNPGKIKSRIVERACNIKPHNLRRSWHRLHVFDAYLVPMGYLYSMDGVSEKGRPATLYYITQKGKELIR